MFVACEKEGGRVLEITAMPKSHQQMHLIPEQIRMLFCSHGHPYSERREWRQERRGSNPWHRKSSRRETAKTKKNKKSSRPHLNCKHKLAKKFWCFTLSCNNLAELSGFIVFKQRDCTAASSSNPTNTGYLSFHLAVTCSSDNDIKKHPQVVKLCLTWKEWRGKKLLCNPTEEYTVVSLYKGTVWCVFSQ